MHANKDFNVAKTQVVTGLMRKLTYDIRHKTTNENKNKTKQNKK
jgi:hypothetical protein